MHLENLLWLCRLKIVCVVSSYKSVLNEIKILCSSVLQTSHNAGNSDSEKNGSRDQLNSVSKNLDVTQDA